MSLSHGASALGTAQELGQDVSECSDDGGLSELQVDSVVGKRFDEVALFVRPRVPSAREGRERATGVRIVDKAQASSTSSSIRSKTTASNRASLVGKWRTPSLRQRRRDGLSHRRHVRALAPKEVRALRAPVSIAPRVRPQRANLRAVDGRNPASDAGVSDRVHWTNLLAAPANGACVPYSEAGHRSVSRRTIVFDPSERDCNERTGRPAGTSRSIERERLVALVDHYLTTLDEPSSFDEDWARSLFTEDVRLEHEIAVLEGVEEVAAAHRLVMDRWERTFHFTPTIALSSMANTPI